MKVTENQPDLRDTIRGQVRAPIEKAQRLLRLLPRLAPHYRTALRDGLRRYGPELTERSLRSWRNLVRSLIGVELMRVAHTLPPGMFPELWSPAAPKTAANLEHWKKKDKNFPEADAAWALSEEGGNQSWLRVEFADNHGGYFKGIVPDTQHIRSGVQGHERPVQFLEEYQWADYCLPQLAARALNFADRFSDDSHWKNIAWNLADYVHSGKP
jgi:hypothetical protein